MCMTIHDWLFMFLEPIQKIYSARACCISYYWACAHINLGLPVRVKLSFHGFVHKCLRIDSKNFKIHSSRSVRAPSNFCARAPILFVARAPKNFCARTLFFRAYTLIIFMCAHSIYSCARTQYIHTHALNIFIRAPPIYSRARHSLYSCAHTHYIHARTLIIFTRSHSFYWCAYISFKKVFELKISNISEQFSYKY